MDDDRGVSSLRRIAEPVEPPADFLDRLYDSLADELGFRGKPARARVWWLGRPDGRRSRQRHVPLWFAAAVLVALAVLAGVAAVGAYLEHRTAPDLPSLQGEWVTTGRLVEGRADCSATLLPDGKVLVAGGTNGDMSAELYDPRTGTWGATGRMLEGRWGHSATALPDGRVLVAGGSDRDAPIATAELYDPATGSWSPAGTLVEARDNHTATLLPDGRVLIAGGGDGDPSTLTRLRSAELYDPATGTWTTTGRLKTGRSFHTATLLPDGTVLAAGGGSNGDDVASAELYDPATGTWTPTGAMTVARWGHTATLLPNGTVLVAGRDGDGIFPSELYDPRTRAWTATGTMTERRWNYTATLLPDGMVLAAGSNTYSQDGPLSSSAEAYDPASGTWTPTDSMKVGRAWHCATLLPDGNVLVAGGSRPDSAASAELYDPGSGR